jgi:hypothetical protein
MTRECEDPLNLTSFCRLLIFLPAEGEKKRHSLSQGSANSHKKTLRPSPRNPSGGCAILVQVLKAQDALASDQRQEELKRQAEYMATAFAEASLKERSNRVAALDEVRLSKFPPGGGGDSHSSRPGY